MFFAETLAARRGLLMDVVPVGLAIAASAFGVIYSLRFVRGVFFGPVSTRLRRQPHEPPRWMRTPIGLLALACLLVGIDRKSTRLELQSIMRISYAVFCLKTKR